MSRFLQSRAVSTAGAFSAAIVGGCSGFQLNTDVSVDAGPTLTAGALCATASEIGDLPDYPQGFHVVGNRIQDSSGNPVILHGVSRSGTEYRCIQTGGFFDGACDEDSVRAMASWNINAVRVPLNETCWLAINGAPAAFAGENYKASIRSYVQLLHKYKLIPILELHWTAPGSNKATGQQPMPDIDHSLDFWREVAATFLDDKGVIFEPFNEPFPGNNQDSDAAWACWQDGCTVSIRAMGSAPAVTYTGAGMQALVSAIRETRADQLILLGGVQYSNSLTQWRAHQPNDPLGNVAAAWHIYPGNRCDDRDNQACWNGAPASLAADVPIVATEIGEYDCAGTFITTVMTWLDAHSLGYLAWSWNVSTACMPGTKQGSTSLVVDYAAGTANGAYAQTFHDYLMMKQ